MLDLKTSHLHDLKSVGHHLLNSARDKGQDTTQPLAFVGLVTMAIGATMLLKAYREMEAGQVRSR